MRDWSGHYASSRGFRRWPNEELVRFLSQQPEGGRWLEAGCGGGGNLTALSENGRQVVGADFSRDAIDVACQVHQNVVQADVFSLPFPDECFDGVVDSMVSQHFSLSDHVQLFTELLRVTKPGGCLWCYHLDSDTMGHRSLFPSVENFTLMSPEILCQFIEMCGYSVVSVSRLRREYPEGQVASYSAVHAVREGAQAPVPREDK